MATDPVEDAIYGLGLSLKMASANVVRVQRAQLATVLTALRDKEAECAEAEDALCQLRRVNAETLRPLAARAEAAESRASTLSARLEALVGACRPFVDMRLWVEGDPRYFGKNPAREDFIALKSAHDAALNGAAK